MKNAVSDSNHFGFLYISENSHARAFLKNETYSFRLPGTNAANEKSKRKILYRIFPEKSIGKTPNWISNYQTVIGPIKLDRDKSTKSY